MRARAAALAAARGFFAARNILEVDTPALGEYGVTDPHIQSIPVKLHSAPDQTAFLQTSPESAMKRLLAAGWPDVYQLCKVFRDGERGRLHQPEFTLIEWYRRGLSLDEMVDETCALIATLLAAAGSPAAAPSITRHRYQDVFRRATGLDPLGADTFELRDRAREWAPGLGDAARTDDDRLLWLDLLMSHAVQPSLAADALSVVHHYPAAQGALARLDPEDPRWVERFEVFYGGLELANGYRELTDATEQRERFAADRRRRAAAGLPDMQPDLHLITALEHGLPDCSGVAVGVERVLMCALGVDTIDEVVGFPL